MTVVKVRLSASEKPVNLSGEEQVKEEVHLIFYKEE